MSAPLELPGGATRSTLPSRLRTRATVAGGLALTAVLTSGLVSFAISALAGGGRYVEYPLDRPPEATFVPREPPGGVWVAVDLGRNRLRVYRGEELLREAVCSVGSGARLVDRTGEREWLFDTPIGLRTVQRKVRDPLWVKPDWAFVEEGLVPPPLGSPDRYDRVSLGDYALYLGDGYLIHGTLFPSLLGQAVTHGCIRLGAEDLEYLYRTAPVGTRVYLY